jgi:hypothetical protein
MEKEWKLTWKSPGIKHRKGVGMTRLSLLIAPKLREWLQVTLQSGIPWYRKYQLMIE